MSSYLGCVVCSKLLELKCIPADTVVEQLTNNFEHFCEYLESMCNVLITTNFDFFQEPFPFCGNCKEKLEVLSNYHDQILRINENIQALMMSITSDVVESFEDPRNQHLSKHGSLQDVRKPHEVADTLLKKINAFRTQIFRRFSPWIPLLPSKEADLKPGDPNEAYDKLIATGDFRRRKKSDKMPDPTKYIFRFDNSVPVKVEANYEHEHEGDASMDQHEVDASMDQLEDLNCAQSINGSDYPHDGTDVASVEATDYMDNSEQSDEDFEVDSKRRSRRKQIFPKSTKKAKKWVMHMEGRVFCEHCKRSFLSKSVLDWHMRHKHADLLDPAELAAPPDQKAYLPVVGGPKRKGNNEGGENENLPDSLRCHICGKVFKRNEYLVNHLARHDGRTKFNCEHCDKKFLKKYSLTLHMRIHLDLRPFQCSICGKTFRSKAQLNAHLPVHYKEQKLPPTHECDQCSKKYHDLRSLIRHRDTIHMGIIPEKTCTCERCGKSFMRMCYLNDHLKYCNKGKARFKNEPNCHFCNELFPSHVELIKHLALHYEGKIPGGKLSDSNKVMLTSVSAPASNNPRNSVAVNKEPSRQIPNSSKGHEDGGVQC